MPGRTRLISAVWEERDDLTEASVPPAYPKLAQDLRTEVLIVGGGIAGLQIAYELLTSGVKGVVIVEDGSR